MTLASLTAHGAANYPNREALIFEKDIYTYAQLEEATNRVANALVASGAQKGDRMAIFLPNRPEFLLSLLGIVKAGGVAVILNTGVKSDEIEAIVRRSAPSRLITTAHLYKQIEDLRDELPELKNVYFVDRDDDPDAAFETLLQGDPSKVPVAVNSDDVASILFTAGITATPKGATLTHGNYIANIEMIAKTSGMDEETRMLGILPLFHVMGLTIGALAPLYAGGTVVLQRGFSVRNFLPTVEVRQVTAMVAVPTVFAILNQLPKRDMFDLSRLKLCISGGSPLSSDTLKAFEKNYRATILEGYGLTEATCAVTLNPPGERRLGSVGLPLPGMELKLLDDNGVELDVNQEGEINIAGPSVMKEYYDYPEATNAVLHQGWLSTGDLGYRDEDGYFYITGRKKELIIRGGENIYPLEVEEALIADSRIVDCSVIGAPDPIWGEEVVAFIRKAADVELTEQDVMDTTRHKLSDFKCPTRVIFVEDLPKTATGKIRKGLLADQYRKSHRK